MPLADYLAGAAFFVATGGMVALGTLLVLRRRLAHLPSPHAVLAFSLIYTAGIVLVHLVPGVFGVLTREVVVVCAALVLVATWRLPARATVKPSSAPDPGPSTRVSWALAGVCVVANAAYIVAFAWEQATLAPVQSVDAVGFHLPGIARWIQTGSIWQINQFFPYQGQGNYPQNGNLVFLSAMLPWSSDFLARLVCYPFLAITALAVYGLGRQLGAPRALAVLTTSVLIAMPVVTLPAISNATPDTIMLATFAAGVLFLMRHARTRHTSDLVLAGLGLGLGLGTKWYGLTAAAVVFVVWALASRLAHRSLGMLARQGALLAGVIGLSGGFWLVRNVVESGSPVFPAKVALFGVTLFDAPPDPYREAQGFALADYLDQPGIWVEYVIPAFQQYLGTGSLLLALGVVAAGPLGWAAWAAARRRSSAPRERTGGLVLAGVACALLIAVAYMVTPYSAFGPRNEPIFVGPDSRYVIPAFLLAAALSAWVAGRMGRWRVVLEVAAVLAVFEALWWSARLFGGVYLTRTVSVGATVAVVVMALAALAVHRRYGVLVPRSAATRRIGMLAVAVVLLVAGHPFQERFHQQRYRDVQRTFEWMMANAPAGHRVGLAGGWEAGVQPALPALGPRFGNEVEYVGPWVDGQLRIYPERDSFLAALDRGGFDLLMVGRGAPPGRRGREGVWAVSAGWSRVARDKFFILYRRPGLDSAGS